MTIPVVHYGLGPIGIEVARLVARRAGLTSVAAVDIDERLAGRPQAEVIRATAPEPVPVPVPVTPSLPALPADPPPVVLHCTGSSLPAVLPQLLACIEAGCQVVSTCEELSHPWRTRPGLAARLDDAARAAAVTVLGTGVNPGYAMDYLPVTLTAACHAVDHIAVHRVQDAGARRLPLQRKVGAGMSRAEFEAAASAGRVRHCGLAESVWQVGTALGWSLVEVTEELEPVIAEHDLTSGVGAIPAGHAAGVRQVCRGRDATGERIVLILEMAVGLDRPRDEVHVTGTPDLHLEVPGGLPGDLATAAVVVNSIPQVLAAPPGLRVTTELPPPRPIP